MKEENKYKMQRSVVTPSSFEEADDHVTYWKDKTPIERLSAACFIINNLFAITPGIKMRRDILTSRKHNNG